MFLEACIIGKLLSDQQLRTRISKEIWKFFEDNDNSEAKAADIYPLTNTACGFVKLYTLTQTR